MENRVIKFRAWQGIKSNGKKSMMKKRMIGWSEISRGWSFYEFQNAGLYDRILMQFTGLTDKHGVEIYEGDVVSKCYGSSVKTGVVAWHQERAMFILQDGFNEPLYQLPLNMIEVIGNIHENKDMLTV